MPSLLCNWMADMALGGPHSQVMGSPGERRSQASRPGAPRSSRGSKLTRGLPCLPTCQMSLRIPSSPLNFARSYVMPVKLLCCELSREPGAPDPRAWEPVPGWDGCAAELGREATGRAEPGPRLSSWAAGESWEDGPGPSTRGLWVEGLPLLLRCQYLEWAVCPLNYKLDLGYLGGEGLWDPRNSTQDYELYRPKMPPSLLLS